MTEKPPSSDFPRDPNAPNQGYPPGVQTESPYPPPPAPRMMARAKQAVPVVTYTIMAVTIGVYLLQILSGNLIGINPYGYDPVTFFGIKINQLIIQGELWRLFTPMLLHDPNLPFGLLHIGFNMYALYVIGPGLERRFGRLRYLVLYVIAGFAGNVISFIFSPYASLGASTAIMGLLGAEGIFIYRNRQLFGKMARPALNQILMIAGINLIIGTSGGIDNAGHIGGLLGGVLFTWLAGPLLVLEGIPPYASVHDDHGTRDLILGGIAVTALFALIATARISGIF